MFFVPLFSFHSSIFLQWNNGVLLLHPETREQAAPRRSGEHFAALLRSLELRSEELRARESSNKFGSSLASALFDMMGQQRHCGTACRHELAEESARGESCMGLPHRKCNINYVHAHTRTIIKFTRGTSPC